MTNAKVFLVGGAVRDLLLGLEPKDFDFVVVGSSPEEMLSLGFSQVGADFPVFLHPTTGDEFALARSENKVGEGHKGFECDWEGVTLEDDLLRRDLTINAMAVEVGELRHAIEKQAGWCKFMLNLGACEDFVTGLVDPFGGRQDIKDKRLQVVGAAFVEDPLRVLRLARFLARLGKDWCVESHTWMLCQTLVNDWKLDELTPERIWKEVERALMEDNPQLFFSFLCDLEWSGVRELITLRGCNQRPDFHPEICTLEHVMQCLKVSADNGLSLPERFAVLCHDLGKPEALERSGGKNMAMHEVLGLPLIEGLCDRWKVTNECRDLAKKVCRYHTNVHNIKNMRPAKIVDMFTKLDAFRNPDVIGSLGRTGICDAWGRTEKFHGQPYPQSEVLQELFDVAKSVKFKHVQHNSRKPLDTGEKIKEAIRQERIRQVKQVVR